MNGFLRFVAMLIGLLILAGSVAAWYYWKIDGFVACLIGLLGFAIIEYGLTGKSSVVDV